MWHYYRFCCRIYSIDMSISMRPSRSMIRVPRNQLNAAYINIVGLQCSGIEKGYICWCLTQAVGQYHSRKEINFLFPMNKVQMTRTWYFHFEATTIWCFDQNRETSTTQHCIEDDPIFHITSSYYRRRFCFPPISIPIGILVNMSSNEQYCWARPPPPQLRSLVHMIYELYSNIFFLSYSQSLWCLVGFRLSELPLDAWQERVFRVCYFIGHVTDLRTAEYADDDVSIQKTHSVWPLADVCVCVRAKSRRAIITEHTRTAVHGQAEEISLRPSARHTLLMCAQRERK